MRIPWSLIGIAAVLLPLGAYVAGTMAGSSEAPEQRAPIVVSGTLTPDPSDVDPHQQGDDPDGKSGTPGHQNKPTGPAKPKKPKVVRPNIDDDDDDDDNENEDEDEDDDDDDEDDD